MLQNGLQEAEYLTLILHTITNYILYFSKSNIFHLAPTFLKVDLTYSIWIQEAE
jgi:hypothetical protein